MINTKTRYVRLDAFRGFLAIGVVAYHSHLHPFFPWYWMSMDVFFVMSGFLITKSMISIKEKKEEQQIFSYIGPLDYSLFFLLCFFQLSYLFLYAIKIYYFKVGVTKLNLVSLCIIFLFCKMLTLFCGGKRCSLEELVWTTFGRSLLRNISM